MSREPINRTLSFLHSGNIVLNKIVIASCIALNFGCYCAFLIINKTSPKNPAIKRNSIMAIRYAPAIVGNSARNQNRSVLPEPSNQSTRHHFILSCTNCSNCHAKGIRILNTKKSIPVLLRSISLSLRSMSPVIPIFIVQKYGKLARA